MIFPHNFWTWFFTRLSTLSKRLLNFCRFFWINSNYLRIPKISNRSEFLKFLNKFSENSLSEDDPFSLYPKVEPISFICNYFAYLKKNLFVKVMLMNFKRLFYATKLYFCTGKSKSNGRKIIGRVGIGCLVWMCDQFSANDISSLENELSSEFDNFGVNRRTSFQLKTD